MFMRIWNLFPLLLFVALTPLPTHARNPRADCIPFDEASNYVGSSQCVKGIVVRVENTRSGLTVLSFCKEANACPFAAIVFPKDAAKLGDLQQLEGKQVEITGEIEKYEGRPQLILRRSQQLGESAFLVFAPVLTEYDVEKRGHYSAGKFRPPKSKKSRKKHDPRVSIEDPEEPQ